MKKLIKLWLAAVLTMVTMVVSAKDYTAGFFGIENGGEVLNTRSIQFGIDHISRKGGGRLIFPAGKYLTGCIHLKSGVTLHLEEGAVLLGSVNPLDYDRQDTPFDHNYQTSLALILGLNQQNIAITGKGVINGQGKLLAANVGELLKKGLLTGGTISRPNEDNRPMIINFYGCDKVTVKGINLKNAACWVQCYNKCKNVVVDSVRVDSKAFWNNDGIDIVDCTDFEVTNSYFNSSDDGICLKSLDTGALNENIRMKNNSITTHASGIKFGTASLGGFKNIQIANNKVFDTYRSALALEAVDGAIIENIEVDGLQGINVGNGVFIRSGARKGKRKSSIKKVSVKNIKVEIRAEKDPVEVLPGLIIAGLPDRGIINITLSNIIIKMPGGIGRSAQKITIDKLKEVPEKANGYPEYSMFGELPAWGAYIRHASNVQITGLNIIAFKANYKTAIVLDDVHHIMFKKLTIKNAAGSKKIFTANPTEVKVKY